jgi:CSLREA domain-containing protein
MNQKVRFRVLWLAAVILATAIFAQGAYRVTKTAYTEDGVCDAGCSLREAVMRADSDSASDVIIFSSSLTGTTVEVDNPIQFFNSWRQFRL